MKQDLEQLINEIKNHFDTQIIQLKARIDQLETQNSNLLQIIENKAMFDMKPQPKSFMVVMENGKRIIKEIERKE